MKEVIEIFKKLRSTPRGRAVIFFAVSFLFFVFIAIYARVVGTHPIDEMYKNASSDENLFGELKNYTYEVNVNLDGKITKIVGKVDEDTEEFTYNKVTYYVVEDRVYNSKDGELIITSNPNPYYRITNTSVIQRLIKNSYLDSTTTYHDESVVYNYLMDTNKLNEIVLKKKTDIESNMNKLIVKVNKDDLIDTISYELDDYCIKNKICKKGMAIELKFSNIGSTEEIGNNE